MKLNNAVHFTSIRLSRPSFTGNEFRQPERENVPDSIKVHQLESLYCRAENWWHISTQKPPNVGSSSAISEPIIAGLVSARGLPNPMKLGNQLHRPTQTR